MPANHIVPWRCHVCGKETGDEAELFPDGRLCGRCTKMTCHRHLKRVARGKQAGVEAREEYVCVACEPPPSNQ